MIMNAVNDKTPTERIPDSGKQREYGIDLLKIFAMFAIVLEHIVHWEGWGLFAQPQYGQSAEWMRKALSLEFIEALLICHVNCFVLASGWIMSRKSFKLSRIAWLWLEVFGYSVAALIVAILFLPQIPLNAKSILKCLFPLSTNSYWFFTQYFGLFFLMPVLNAAVGTLDDRTLKTLLLTGGALASILPMLGRDLFHVSKGYSLIWFAYLYMIAAAMAQRDLFSRISMRAALCVIFACAFATVGGRHVVDVACIHAGIGSRWRIFGAYNSPIILVQSVAALSVFKTIRVRSTRLRRVIAFVAPSVFAVYLIHSNWIFREATHWNAFWTSALDGPGAVKSLAIEFGGATIVFVGCLVVDFAKRGIKAGILRIHNVYLGSGVRR